MNRKKRKILASLSLLGFLDAIYLSLPYFSPVETICSIDKTSTCDLVTSSVYAETFGIPNAFLGVLFFLFLTISFIF